MNDDITYSIVVPVYNGEQVLSELSKRIITSLTQHSFEIIFVDDGSTDKSWHAITQLKASNPDIIKAVRLQKNYGQHAASLCAFSFCNGNYTITIDDDLQYLPEDIPLLINKQKETGCDVIYGVPKTHNHSYLRTLGGNYVKFISRIIGGNEVRGTSFRLINKMNVDNIATYHNNSFVSLDSILKWYTSSFAFVPIDHHPRHKGKSGYNIVKLIKMHGNTIISYSITPLKVMTYLGFIFALIFFMLGTHFIYQKLFHEVPIGYTSIIVAVFFCSSIIMYCLGVIGQYLFKMYISNQNKPLYNIKSVLQ